MYSGDADTNSRQNDHMGRGRPQHALPEGRGHQALDIDSAAAHRIPRGELPLPQQYASYTYTVITVTATCHPQVLTKSQVLTPCKGYATVPGHVGYHTFTIHLNVINRFQKPDHADAS